MAQRLLRESKRVGHVDDIKDMRIRKLTENVVDQQKQICDLSNEVNELKAMMSQLLNQRKRA
jgi:uncharacterized protein YaaR (DUF327 family)